MSEKSNSMTNMAEMAMKNYAEAFRTGLQLQEAATRWWSTLLSPTATLPQWQPPLGNFTALSNGMLPQAQERMAEVMDLMAKTSRTSTQLVQQAVAAAQTPNPAESQAKWMALWLTSFDALRSNVEAVAQFNTRALNAWVGLTRATATGKS